MADDLELMMRFVEGEGPSPEFVANLRERIVAETGSPATTVDDGSIFVIDLRPPPEEHVTTTTRQWILVAAAAIVVIIGFLALSGNGDDRRLDTINPPEETTTTTVTTSPQVPATFVADATLLTDESSLLEEGTYRIDILGTPVTFTLDQPQGLHDNHRAHFVLTHPSSQGTDDRSIKFMRLSALSDPGQPSFGLENFDTAYPVDLGEGWPADDFTGWLDNLTDEIVVSNREKTTLGGLEATRVDLQLGETDCSFGDGFCMLFGTNHLVDSKVLNTGSTYRIWVVDQNGDDPLAVIVGINRDSDSDWFTTADTILSTLAFGGVAPNPILEASPGPVELPFLGGIRTELAEGSYAMLDPQKFGKVVLTDWEVHTGFLITPLDSTGNVLDTPDDLLAALEQSNTTVAEIESTVIDGIDARVFDIAGTSPQPALKLTPDADNGWLTPTRGRMWLIDHPDRGLLMITAEAFDRIDIVFPIVLTQTEAIIESLVFIELD